MTLIDRSAAWLAGYVDSLRTDDPATNDTLARKLGHCDRVRADVRGLAESLDIDEELARLAELAGLLHDAGRFAQIAGHGTFDDQASVNHGRAGALLLLDLALLDELAPAERKILVLAANYHNRNTVPSNIRGRARLVLDMVRDADKLDVLEINLGHLHPDAPHSKVLKAGLTWDENAVSDSVLELAGSRATIPFEAIRWSNDFVLFLACWIYDLNFPWTAREMNRRGTMERILDRLPDSPVITPLKGRFQADLAAFSKNGHF